MRLQIITTAASIAACLALTADGAMAQSTPARPGTSAPLIAIDVPKLLLCEPGTGTPLDVKLTPLAAVPPNSYMRIKGLPATVQPSDGHQIAAGAWAVPIDGLGRVLLRVQGSTQTKSEINLTLFSIEGRILAEARSTLIVAPAGLITPSAAAAPTLVKPPARAVPIVPPVPPAVGSPAAPAPIAPQSMPDDVRVQATRLHERALGQLATGNIPAARSLLERAVDLGWADSAMVLAGTYDTLELERLGVVGVQPDAAIARRWYQRAQALGATDAAARMAKLAR